MMIYVDGDNAPGCRTNGAAALEDTDTLYIYYSSSNQHYKSEKRQKALIEQVSCAIEFIEIKPANNAVDFAIAIDAGIAAYTKEGETIVLISEDKHFQTITKHLEGINKKMSVNLEKNVHDAILKHKIFEFKTIDGLEFCLQELYGMNKGSAFFNYLESLFLKKTKPKLSIFQRIVMKAHLGKNNKL